MASGENGESNCMSEDVMELVNTYQLSTFSTKVCKYAAVTKEEWEEQCKLWPTSFHPPTYNIDGITGFSEEDSLSVLNFMKLAVRMAKSGTSVANAAVIVDPSTREIIAGSYDQVLSHNARTNCSSTESCFSKMPDEISSSPKSSSDEAKQCYEDVSCLHPRGWIKQCLHSNPDSWHPLQHAAIAAIENSAARDRHLFPANRQAEDFPQETYNVSSPIGSPLKRQKVNSNVLNLFRQWMTKEWTVEGMVPNATRQDLIYVLATILPNATRQDLIYVLATIFTLCGSLALCVRWQS